MNLLKRFKTHKMPEKSFFYDRIIPAMFIALGLITIGLIIFAIGVLTGFVAWV